MLQKISEAVKEFDSAPSPLRERGLIIRILLGVSYLCIMFFGKATPLPE